MEYSVTKTVTEGDEVTKSSHSRNKSLSFIDFAKL